MSDGISKHRVVYELLNTQPHKLPAPQMHQIRSFAPNWTNARLEMFLPEREVDFARCRCFACLFNFSCCHIGS
jgi:hypothetical protein